MRTARPGQGGLPGGDATPSYSSRPSSVAAGEKMFGSVVHYHLLPRPGTSGAPSRGTSTTRGGSTTPHGGGANQHSSSGSRPLASRPPFGGGVAKQQQFWTSKSRATLA
eukprot:1178732-Prorocentrum_minimum.AAC.2